MIAKGAVSLAGLVAGQLVNAAALAGVFLAGSGEVAAPIAAAAIAGLNTYLCVRLSLPTRAAPAPPPVILKLHRRERP